MSNRAKDSGVRNGCGKYTLANGETGYLVRPSEQMPMFISDKLVDSCNFAKKVRNQLGGIHLDISSKPIERKLEIC